MDTNTKTSKQSAKPWRIIIPLIILAIIGACCLSGAVVYSLAKRNFNSAVSNTLNSIQQGATSTPSITVTITPTAELTSTPAADNSNQPLSKKQTSNSCNLIASTQDSSEWKLDEKTEDFLMLKFTTVKITHNNISTIEVICADNNGFISVNDLFSTAQKELKDKGVDLKTKNDENIWGRTVKVVEAQSNEGSVTLYAFTTNKKIYIVRKDTTKADQNLKDTIEKTFQKLQFNE